MTLSTIIALWLIMDVVTFMLFRYSCRKTSGESADAKRLSSEAEILFNSPLHIAIALVLGLAAWWVVLPRLVWDELFRR